MASSSQLNSVSEQLVPLSGAHSSPSSVINWMELLLDLPHEFMVSEILERIDMREVHKLAAVNKFFHEILSGSEFIQRYNKRHKTDTWLLTHYISAEDVFHGSLKCVRIRDLMEFDLQLAPIFDCLENLDNIKLITAKGNFAVFLTGPNNASFVVVNLLLKSDSRIACPAPFFEVDWHRKEFILEMETNCSHWHLTFIQMVGGIARYLETDSSNEQPYWVRRESQFSANMSLFLEKAAIYISSEHRQLMHNIVLDTRDRQLYFNRFEISTDQLISLVNQFGDHPIEGHPYKFDWIYTSYGWIIGYETKTCETRRLRTLYIFQMQMSEIKLVSLYHTQKAMTEFDDLLRIWAQVIEDRIYVVAQSRNKNGQDMISTSLDIISTSLFLYEIQENSWSTTRIEDINCLEAYDQMHTNLSVMDKNDIGYMWPPKTIIENLQEKQDKDKRQKYVEDIITDSQVVRVMEENWTGILTNLNNIPHSREIKEYFYDDVLQATKRALNDGKIRVKVEINIPELNPEQDAYQIDTFMELVRVLALSFAHDGKRVKVCVQGSMGEEALAGIPLQLAGTRKILEFTDWGSDGAMGNFINIGSIGGKEVDEVDDIFILVAPQNAMGNCIIDDLRAMTDAAGRRPVILINPRLKDLPASSGIMQTMGQEKRLEYAASFEMCYQFRLLYVQGTQNPIMGALRRAYPCRSVLFKRVNEPSGKEKYVILSNIFWSAK